MRCAVSPACRWGCALHDPGPDFSVGQLLSDHLGPLRRSRQRIGGVDQHGCAARDIRNGVRDRIGVTPVEQPQSRVTADGHHAGGDLQHRSRSVPPPDDGAPRERGRHRRHRRGGRHRGDHPLDPRPGPPRRVHHRHRAARRIQRCRDRGAQQLVDTHRGALDEGHRVVEGAQRRERAEGVGPCGRGCADPPDGRRPGLQKDRRLIHLWTVSRTAAHGMAAIHRAAGGTPRDARVSQQSHR